MEVIYSHICPHCKAKCWVNEGDVEDFTKHDTEVTTCWKCEKSWLLDGCEDWTTIEDGYKRESYSTPNEAYGLKS